MTFSRSFLLAALVLPSLHCAEDSPGSDVDPLAGGDLGPPIAMELVYSHDLVRGEDTAILITGAPPNKQVTLLATGNLTGADLCPPQIAPDCLSIAGPVIVVGQRRASATGEVTFVINLPTTVGLPAAELQAVAIDGAQHYVSDAEVLDIVNPPTDVTITSLRTAPPAIGDFIRVEGVVTAVRSNGFALQQPGATTNGGVWVFSSFFAEPMVGDRVKAAGQFSLYDNDGTLTGPADTLTEVDLISGVAGWWAKTGTGTVPTPISVTLADMNDPVFVEAHESMLVRLSESGPLVVNNDPAGAGAFREFKVDLGAGGVLAEIDNDFYDVAAGIPTFSIGDTFTSFTGILNFSFGEYKVAPRQATDAAGYLDAMP